MISIDLKALNKSVRAAEKKVDLMLKAEAEANKKATTAITRQAATKLVDATAKATKVKKSVIRGKKQSNLKWSRLKIYVPQRTGKKQSGFIAMKTGPFPLHQLATKAQMTNGLKRRGFGKGGRQLAIKGRKYPGAFWGTGKSGNVSAFKRKGGSRLPIERVIADYSQAMEKAAKGVRGWSEGAFKTRYLTELRKSKSRLKL